MRKISIALVVGLFLSLNSGSAQAMQQQPFDFNAFLGNLRQAGEQVLAQNFVDPIPAQVPTVSNEFINGEANWQGNVSFALEMSGINLINRYMIPQNYSLDSLKFGLSQFDWSNATITAIAAELGANRTRANVVNANLQQDVCFHVLAALGLAAPHVVHENNVRADILLRNLNNGGIHKADFEALGYTPRPIISQWVQKLDF